VGKRLAYVVAVASPPPISGGGGTSTVFAPLPGAESDARNLTDLLVAEGVQTVVRTAPESTTRTGVLDELDSLVDSLHPGDLFVFTFAGHGWQLADDGGDEETDGLDEVLLLSDGALRDDRFGQLWKRVRSGVRVVCLVDACHSSSAMLGMRPRKGGPPVPTIAPRLAGGPSILVWAACQDSESAFEGAGTSGDVGALTDSFLDAWNAGARVTYSQLWEKTATTFATRFPKLVEFQHPAMRFSGPDASMLADAPFA